MASGISQSGVTPGQCLMLAHDVDAPALINLAHSSALRSHTRYTVIITATKVRSCSGPACVKLVTIEVTLRSPAHTTITNLSPSFVCMRLHLTLRA